MDNDAVLPKANRRMEEMIYIEISETDCDHCRVTYAREFFYKQEVQPYLDDLYDHAEGPIGAWPISRKEYESYQPSFRDFVMEAHEDGHPYSVQG